MSSHEPLRFEMNQLISYDDENIVAEIRRVVALLSPGAITRKAFDGVSRVASSTVVRRYGGWKQALEFAGVGDRYSGRRVSEKMRAQVGKELSDEQLILELRRISTKLGKNTLTLDDVVHSDTIGQRVIRERFGSWSAGLEAAGLSTTPHGRRWTIDDYFDNLLEVWTFYGRAPRYDEMKSSPSRITPGAYENKFGTWGKAKLAFVEKINADIEVGNDSITEQRIGDSPDLRRVNQEQPRYPENEHRIRLGLRYQVLKRDNFKCVLCGRSPATDPDVQLHVDHIVAFSLGGKTVPDNLRTACSDCNIGKGSGN